MRYPRDFRGHGPNAPDAAWPGGAKIAVSIVVLAMLAVAIANFFTTRSSTLAALDTQMLQLSHSHAQAIAEWLRSKQAVVGSLKQGA